MKSTLKFFNLLGLAFSFIGTSQAKIYLDLEPEPLPLVDIVVVLPVGVITRVEEEAGTGALFNEMVDAGTLKRTKQEFLDELSAFGANYDFNVSNQYSYWSLSFPLVEGQNYDKLVELLSENWDSPRFTSEAFETARTKISGAINASVDSDNNLASAPATRWMSLNLFGGYPLFIESIPNLSLEKVKKVFE